MVEVLDKDGFGENIFVRHRFRCRGGHAELIMAVEPDHVKVAMPILQVFQEPLDSMASMKDLKSLWRYRVVSIVETRRMDEIPR